MKNLCIYLRKVKSRKTLRSYSCQLKDRLKIYQYSIGLRQTFFFFFYSRIWSLIYSIKPLLSMLIIYWHCLRLYCRILRSLYMMPFYERLFILLTLLTTLTILFYRTTYILSLCEGFGQSFIWFFLFRLQKKSFILLSRSKVF